jgi:hypothetical protein
MPKLSIYPAIGVARIGNSQNFVPATEWPGVPCNWDPASQRFRSFKDPDGKILRQAAPFRVFLMDDAGNPIKEIKLSDGFKIKWTINVANKKASFFTFNGQSGARNGDVGPYVNRDKRAPTDVEKPGGPDRGNPHRANRRNATVQVRRNLEIAPGPFSISAPGTVELTDNVTTAPIHFLGQAKMEDDGHLLFIPAFGASASLPDAAPIDEYASNDGWFDDMCDGSIDAAVTFPDGHTENAESAWVITGPPDFAPGIGNVVSLYDTIWDLSVRLHLPCAAGNDEDLQELQRQQAAWQDASNDFASPYEPSFTDHIYPILSRALAAFDVHVSSVRAFHTSLWDWTRLSSRAENAIRRSIFDRMRDPNSDQLDRTGMPRGLGDEFNTLDDFETDPENSPPPTARAFLSLTKVQYALLKAWKEGRFKEDWEHGDVKYAPIPQPGIVTPHGMNIAALENCVGGPFFPGIEMSWLIREKDLYASAFRLNATERQIGALTFGPGFFSQQMALPWHADFYDCHREDHPYEGDDGNKYYMWWTAQRPDFIRNGRTSRRWVEPFDANKDGDSPDADDTTNLARFEQMRTRWHELSFIVLEGENHVEQK